MTKKQMIAAAEVKIYLILFVCFCLFFSLFFVFLFRSCFLMILNVMLVMPVKHHFCFNAGRPSP